MIHFNQLRARVRGLPNALQHHEKFQRNFHRTAHAGHLSYYAMVFVESHSLYGYSAGLMFLVTCVGLIMHEDAT